MKEQASFVLSIIQNAIKKYGDLPLCINYPQDRNYSTRMRMYLMTNRATGEKSFWYTCGYLSPHGTPTHDAEVIYESDIFSTWEQS